jgi:hypothetical protein
MHGAIHPLPQYIMVWCSIKKKKNRDNFNFNAPKQIYHRSSSDEEQLLAGRRN